MPVQLRTRLTAWTRRRNVASLMDLARPSATGDIGAYREYVIACGELGKTPLSMAEWIKAGRPSK